MLVFKTFNVDILVYKANQFFSLFEGLELSI